MSRSLGDSKLHAVGVSDVPDVTSIFLEDGPSPQPLGVEVYKLIWMMILVGIFCFFQVPWVVETRIFLLDVDWLDFGKKNVWKLRDGDELLFSYFLRGERSTELMNMFMVMLEWFKPGWVRLVEMGVVVWNLQLCLSRINHHPKTWVDFTKEICFSYKLLPYENSPTWWNPKLTKIHKKHRNPHSGSVPMMFLLQMVKNFRSVSSYAPAPHRGHGSWQLWLRFLIVASDGVPLFFFWGGVGGVFQQHSSWFPLNCFLPFLP